MPDNRIGIRDITHIAIHDESLVPNVRPFGINLGFHNRFGASQIFKNLIVNPGFESGEYATIVIVDRGGSPQRFAADNWKTRWNDDELQIGQPVTFWEGAEYEVVFGASAGRKGHIVRFRHEGDRYAFYTSDRGEAFAVGDVVYLRHKVQSTTAGMTYANYDWHHVRPNSPGKQSLRLTKPSQAWKWSFTYTMDSMWRDLDESAGKLLIVDGEWELSFWMRGGSNQARLQVQFCREGEQIFFEEELSAETRWKRVTRSIRIPRGDDRYIDPANHEQARVLTLKFRVVGGAQVWLDDMSLQRSGQRNPTVFSDRFVARLKQLNPGTLRNWGWQHGSTLRNQLAVPFARKMTGYSPKQRTAYQYHFSLHEFLELADEVGAEPWYVIPPTFTHAEMADLLAYLAAPAGEHPFGRMRADLGQLEPWTNRFAKIHLEYGNEMWGANQGGDPFLGATLRGGERLGTVAGERFASLKRSRFYRDSAEKLNLIIGGQTNVFDRQRELAEFSTTHDTVALSPYFGHLDDQDRQRMFPSLYARAMQDVQDAAHGLLLANDEAKLLSRRPNPVDTGIAVYEINFHTTTNAAVKLEQRNQFVASIAGGIALPLYMLHYLRDSGVRTQCAFTALQYSYAMPGRGLDGQNVKLWGMLRDLEATGRARPTWLALQLTNRAMRGDLVSSVLRGKNPHWRQMTVNHIQSPLMVPYVQSFVFHDAGTFRVLLFNLDQAASQTVQIEFSIMPLTRGVLHQLSAETPTATNEEAENVKIITRRLKDITPQYQLVLPPHSITLLEAQSYNTFFPSVTDTEPER